MTSAPHEQTPPPDDPPPSPRPGDPPETLRRTHARHRARPAASRRIRRTAGFASTVWPCADADPLPGTALLAGWLARTILTLVTGYTSPGHRVLLLATPRPARRTRSTITAADGVTIIGQTGRDPYAGLYEASWPLARLGRGVATATAADPPDYPDWQSDPTGHGADESESGPRPTRSGPGRSTPVDRRSGGRPDPAEGRLPGFDLIITALDPRATRCLADTDWGPLLTPRGILAVITRSDSSGDVVLDPIPTIVATLRRRGLRWCDHIAVLDGPARPAAQIHSTGLSGAGQSARHARRSPSYESLPARQTHHDLLLLLRADSVLSTFAHGDRVAERFGSGEEEIG